MIIIIIQGAIGTTKAAMMAGRKVDNLVNNA